MKELIKNGYIVETKDNYKYVVIDGCLCRIIAISRNKPLKDLLEDDILTIYNTKGYMVERNIDRKNKVYSLNQKDVEKLKYLVDELNIKEVARIIECDSKLIKNALTENKMSYRSYVKIVDFIRNTKRM